MREIILTLFTLLSTASAARTLLRHPAPRASASILSWDTLKTELDEKVPVFVIADELNRPLECERKGASPVCLCFADADAAQAALAAAQNSYPELGLRLMPTGIGNALERTREGRALLVPDLQALQAAREAFPDGEDWDGGALPLFGCRLLQRQRADGTQATPLFLSVRDAKAALANAAAVQAASDSPGGEAPYLVTTSLQSMTQLMVDGDVGAMEFIPPESSIKLCLEAGDGSRSIPLGIKGSIARALPELYTDSATGGGAAGLFPG